MPRFHPLRFAFALIVAALSGSVVQAQGGLDRAALAVKEGQLVIYAATDYALARALLDDFRGLHPGIRVDYQEISSRALYRRFLDEAKAGGVADVVWSSAMDLQVKLVNDGHAQPHRSEETDALPGWASWKNEAFGTSFEPVALVVNRARLRAGDVPESHAALLRLMADPPEYLRGRIATYDPARSGLGFLLHTQDVLANPVVFWRLTEAFGRAGTRAYASTSEMLDRIADGDALIGYNLLGSYAQVRAMQDERLAVVLPRDYTLVLSRVAFIARQAKHPNAARLWLDYLLSRRGQQLLAANPGFYAVREDVAGNEAAEQLRRSLGGAFRPIPIGTGLLTHLDQIKRRDFLRQWHETIAPMP